MSPKVRENYSDVSFQKSITCKYLHVTVTLNIYALTSIQMKYAYS